MFITITDLSKSLYPDVRELLSRFAEATVLEHCATAEAEIEAHLAQRYHIRPELEKTGTDRHKLLVMIGRDIAIYHLYQLAETLPAKVVKRYDEAIRLLREIASGKIVLPAVASAPEPEPGTPTGDQIAHGGRPPRAPLFT